MALSQIWTLKRASDGLEQTFAAWGISSAVLTRRSQRTDDFIIKLGQSKFDDAEVFAYGSTITIKRNGSVYFVGIATKTPRMGRPNAESVSYTFEGPWWCLEHVVYQQDWNFLNFLTLQQVSDLVLATANDGSLVTTGSEIAAAVTCAIASGSPLQIGIIDPAIQVPPEAARDLSCADVIRRMLRWHPDCVTWIDYTTTPPTLNARARGNLPGVSFSVAGSPVTGLDVAARPDLVPPVVVLKYQTLNQINGEDQSYINIDQYPALVSELQPGAIVMTIDLQGSRVSYMKQYIKTEALDPTSLDWWKERLPALTDSNIINLAYVVSSGAATPILADGGSSDGTDPSSVQSSTSGTVYSENLLEGEFPEWLASGHTQMALVTAKVNYDVKMGNDANGNPVLEHHANEVLTCKVLSTDLSTGWYKQLASDFIGETPPTGLAQYYYEALSTLQYEGSFEITEIEAGTSNLQYLGKVLNWTGGCAEWATMNALIFEVSENLATGKTRLRFGPAHYLSPKDWIDLLRQNRERVYGDVASRVNGVLTSSSNPVGGSGKHDRGGHGSSKAQPQLTTWVGPPSGGNPGTYSITILPATAESGGTIPQNLNVRLRPVSICDPASGTMKTMYVLCSETF